MKLFKNLISLVVLLVSLTSNVNAVTVTSAMYGAPGYNPNCLWMDVTAKLRSSSNFTVNSDTFGSDPCPGKAKSLVIMSRKQKDPIIVAENNVFSDYNAYKYVNKAYYGAGTAFDATTQVLMIQDSNPQVSSTNLGFDPAPGKVKQLIITYSDGTTKTIKDNDIIPSPPADPIQPQTVSYGPVKNEAVQSLIKSLKNSFDALDAANLNQSTVALRAPLFTPGSSFSVLPGGDFFLDSTDFNLSDKVKNVLNMCTSNTYNYASMNVMFDRIGATDTAKKCAQDAQMLLNVLAGGDSSSALDQYKKAKQAADALQLKIEADKPAIAGLIKNINDDLDQMNAKFSALRKGAILFTHSGAPGASGSALGNYYLDSNDKNLSMSAQNVMKMCKGATIELLHDDNLVKKCITDTQVLIDSLANPGKAAADAQAALSANIQKGLQAQKDAIALAAQQAEQPKLDLIKSLNDYLDELDQNSTANRLTPFLSAQSRQPQGMYYLNNTDQYLIVNTKNVLNVCSRTDTGTDAKKRTKCVQDAQSLLNLLTSGGATSAQLAQVTKNQTIEKLINALNVAAKNKLGSFYLTINDVQLADKVKVMQAQCKQSNNQQCVQAAQALLDVLKGEFAAESCLPALRNNQSLDKMCPTVCAAKGHQYCPGRSICSTSDYNCGCYSDIGKCPPPLPEKPAKFMMCAGTPLLNNSNFDALCPAVCSGNSQYCPGAPACVGFSYSQCGCYFNNGKCPIAVARPVVQSASQVDINDKDRVTKTIARIVDNYKSSIQPLYVIGKNPTGQEIVDKESANLEVVKSNQMNLIHPWIDEIFGLENTPLRYTPAQKAEMLDNLAFGLKQLFKLPDVIKSDDKAVDENTRYNEMKEIALYMEKNNLSWLFANDGKNDPQNVRYSSLKNLMDNIVLNVIPLNADNPDRQARLVTALVYALKKFAGALINYKFLIRNNTDDELQIVLQERSCLKEQTISIKPRDAQSLSSSGCPVNSIVLKNAQGAVLNIQDSQGVITKAYSIPVNTEMMQWQIDKNSDGSYTICTANCPVLK